MSIDKIAEDMENLVEATKDIALPVVIRKRELLLKYNYGNWYRDGIEARTKSKIEYYESLYKDRPEIN